MKVSLLIIVSTLLLAHASGQENAEPWSLEKCISHAREHNLAIKQRNLNAQVAENNYLQRKLNFLPSLNISSGFTTNMGRVRDEVNFQIIDMTTRVTNASLVSSTPVFEGFTRGNSIKLGKIDWETALLEVEKTGNDIALTIAALYLQILLDKELLEAGRQNMELVTLQVDRVGKLVQAGSLPEVNLFEIRALEAREAATLTRLNNNLALSLLELAQALDLERTEGFSVVVPSLEEIPQMMPVNAGAVYELAVNELPQVEIAELRLQGSAVEEKIARGYLYPRLHFQAGWGSSVSWLKDGPGFDFNRRFRDNAHSYLGLNLSIPVFNGLQARTGVKNAEAGVQNARYELQRQKLALQKEIEQAIADASAALRQYMASKAAAEAYREAFRYTGERYNLGMANIVDFNVSKTEYMNAGSSYIQAKYAFLLRLKILDFYQGKPLAL